MLHTFAFQNRLAMMFMHACTTWMWPANKAVAGFLDCPSIMHSIRLEAIARKKCIRTWTCPKVQPHFMQLKYKDMWHAGERKCNLFIQTVSYQCVIVFIRRPWIIDLFLIASRSTVIFLLRKPHPVPSLWRVHQPRSISRRVLAPLSPSTKTTIRIGVCLYLLWLEALVGRRTSSVVDWRPSIVRAS